MKIYKLKADYSIEITNGLNHKIIPLAAISLQWVGYLSFLQSANESTVFGCLVDLIAKHGSSS